MWATAQMSGVYGGVELLGLGKVSGLSPPKGTRLVVRIIFDTQVEDMFIYYLLSWRLSLASKKHSFEPLCALS